MDPEGPRIQIILGAVFFVLVFVNAFFAISETAFSFCNRARLKVRAEDGGRRARTALKVVAGFDKALIALMIGNNVAHVATSAIATVIFIGFFGVNLGAVMATAFTTVVILFLGEAIPKNIAQQNADRIVLLVAYPVRLLMIILTPFTIFFGGIIALYKRPFKGNVKAEAQLSEEDISDIIDAAEEEGVIDEVEGDIIQNAIEFGDTAVKDVLTPADRIVAVDINDSTETILNTIAQKGYSRYPVTDGGIDNIIGMLHTRTYLKALSKNRRVKLMDKIMPPYTVTPLISLDEMFSGFREHRTHMAIVTDNGKTIGMVTMEDVLEELVGEEKEDAL